MACCDTVGEGEARSFSKLYGLRDAERFGEALRLALRFGEGLRDAERFGEALRDAERFGEALRGEALRGEALRGEGLRLALRFELALVVLFFLHRFVFGLRCHPGGHLMNVLYLTIFVPVVGIFF